MGYELYIFYIGGIHALLDPLGFKMDLSGDMGYASFILEEFMHYWIPWVSKCSKWTSVEIWVIHLLYWRDSCTNGSLGFHHQDQNNMYPNKFVNTQFKYFHNYSP